jgi:plasmid stabilization system protein ParE
VTTITHPAAEAFRRARLRDLVRQRAAAAVGVARSLKAEIANLGAAGQLGPDPDVEVGRWTGTRV